MSNTSRATSHARVRSGTDAPVSSISRNRNVVPDESMSALTTAYLLGAVIIEKHFTHDKTLPGNDHYHAMDVDDLRRFLARVDDIRELVGTDFHKHPLESEAPARRHARRSLVLRRAVPAGHRLAADDLTCKRPGTGISPLSWEDVLGRRVQRDLDVDTVLAWNDLEPPVAAGTGG